MLLTWRSIENEQILYYRLYLSHVDVAPIYLYGGECMRYEYTITKEGGEAEIMKEMSWKKLFKKLLMKYPKFSGWCTYINKHGHVQVRNFNQGRETKKL